MGDTYSSILNPDLRRRLRGFSAYYLGDLVPLGFIKPFEVLNLSASQEPLPNSYELSIDGSNVPNSDPVTPKYLFKFTSSEDDLKDQDGQPLQPDENGKIEKVYAVYLEYVWLSNTRVTDSQGQYSIGGFGIPSSGRVISKRIHVVNDKKFIPGNQAVSGDDLYVIPSVEGTGIAGATAKKAVSIEVIPVFLADKDKYAGKILGPFFEEPRFGAAKVALLPSRALSLWLGFGGGIDLQRAFDPGAAVEGFAGLVFGAGLLDLLAGATAITLRITSPAVYRPYTIKNGYSIVNSSQTIFDQEVTITFNDLFERQDGQDAGYKKKFIEGDNYVLVNKSLGDSFDFISNVFGVFLKPFEFEDLEKRYIGKGLTDSTDPRDGVSQTKFLSKEPCGFAIVKDKIITNMFMRQVKKFRGPTTSIPEEQIPGGSAQIQIFIPKSKISLNTSSFQPLKLYVTYEIVKGPQIRQTNSYKLFATAASGVANVDAKSFYQNHAFVYDKFYVRPDVKYNFAESANRFPIIVNNFDFSAIANLRGVPALYDFSVPPEEFKVSQNVFNGSDPDGDIPKVTVGTYRLAARSVQERSDNFMLAEGIFVAANNLVQDGTNLGGGIGYIDGVGNFTLLISKNDIADKEWWRDNFEAPNNTIFVNSYLDDGPSIIAVKYDRSLISNSMFTDDEKIGYDSVLADALMTIEKKSDGGFGVGICLLDFLNVQNFNLKNEVSSFKKYASEIQSEEDSQLYYDLSEAIFSGVVNPNWTLNIIQILPPSLSSTGQETGRATIVGENFCFDVSPIDISRNGRVFWEGMSGVNAALGVQPYEQLWIRSNAYDVKLGFAADLKKYIGLYAQSYNGKVRIFSADMPSFVFNNSNPALGFENNQEVIDANKSVTSYKYQDRKWFGLPVDKMPFHQYGGELVSSEDSGFYQENKDGIINYKELIWSSGESIGIKYETPAENGGQFASLTFDSVYRVSYISISFKPFGDSKSKISNDNYYYNIGFDEPQGESFIKKEAISYAYMMGVGGSKNNGLLSEVNIYNCECQKMYFSGPFFEKFKNVKPFYIKVRVFEVDNYDKFVFTANDCFPAIDGYSQGYVGFLNLKNGSPSLDAYMTGDHNRRWKLIRNIFQSFVNENIFQCVLKSDPRGSKLYFMFSLNGNLLCKPIDSWMLSKTKYYDQGIVSSNIFNISISTDKSVIALSPVVYHIIQGLDQYSENPQEFDNIARLQSAYVVQARYTDNEFLLKENINTTICQNIKFKGESEKANQSSSSTSNNRSIIQIGDYTVNIPSSSFGLSKLFYPRINVPAIPIIDENNIDDDWAVNQPYTFEVIGNGSLVAFLLKDGFVHMKWSQNGQNWSNIFNMSRLFGFRPIKWGVNDQDSFIDTEKNEYFPGSAVSIDNISSCYDFQSGKLTLFYMIGNAIFGQNFDLSSFQGLNSSNSVVKYMQTKNNPKHSPYHPYYVVGEMPSGMVEAIRAGNSFVNFGFISDVNSQRISGLSQLEKNIGSNESIVNSYSNLKTNGKAPGACYVGNDVIRLYYEDDSNIIRGVTITNSIVKPDLLTISDSVFSELN